MSIPNYQIKMALFRIVDNPYLRKQEPVKPRLMTYHETLLASMPHVNGGGIFSYSSHACRGIS